MTVNESQLSAERPWVIPASEAVRNAARELIPLLAEVRTEEEVVLRAVSIMYQAIGHRLLIEDPAGEQYELAIWRDRP